MEDKKIFKFIFQNRNVIYDVNEDYICIICHRLLCDPFSARCGCSFCKECKEEHFVNNNSCPGKDSECIFTNEENAEFARNHGLRSKIKNMQINCPNTDCSVNLTIEQMINHFVECEKRQIPCEFSTLGCSTEIALDHMEDHQNNNVVTHLKFVLENMNKLANENNVLRSKVEAMDNTYNALWENVSEISIKNGMNDAVIDILQKKVADLERENTNLLVEIAEIKNQNYNKITGLENKIKELRNIRNNDNKNYDNKITGLENKIKQLRNTRDNDSKKYNSKFQLLQNKVENLEKESANLENNKINKFQSNNETLFQQNQVKSGMDKTEKEIKNQVDKVNMLTIKCIQGQPKRDVTIKKIINELTFPSASASFIWKINDLPKKREQMVMIQSNKIYMYNNGYKMKIIIYPKGERGVNMDLSVYVAICIGEFDNDLDWPFRKNIKLSLIDPLNMKEWNIFNCNYEMVEQGSKKLFDKPSNTDNTGFGAPNFISWNELQAQDSPMKDGTIFVKLTLTM